jgi:D-alanine transaminase
MSVVFLNGAYMPMEEARISPMDRGFLFGDGIYEVIPSYSGRSVGFAQHMSRLRDGLAAISLGYDAGDQEWRDIISRLVTENEGDNLGVYIQISRGASDTRNHAMPEAIEATRYAFAYEIPPAPIADKALAPRYRVSATRDLRWQRCNIKSTSLLGNVLHYQHGHERGSAETLLFNADDELTEAAACNVFVIKNGVVATPELDHQKLPGITRLLVLDILRRHSDLRVEERVISRAEVDDADEIWLTSSSKEIAPVVTLEDRPVGTGDIGDVWLQAQRLFSAHKYDY